MARRTRVYVSGTFDCFHRGHVAVLERAATLADDVIVAVDGDALASTRGEHPVMRDDERLSVVRACRHVDVAVLVANLEIQRRYLDHFRPDYILHGDDVMGDALIERMGITDAFLRDLGIRLRYCPRIGGISAEEVRRRVVVAAGE